LDRTEHRRGHVFPEQIAKGSVVNLQQDEEEKHSEVGMKRKEQIRWQDDLRSSGLNGDDK
jgi:hypothetical protein